MPWRSPQEQIERDAQYRIDNKEKIGEYCKQWYIDNKDTSKEQSDKWYIDNRERYQRYYIENKERISNRSVFFSACLRFFAALVTRIVGKASSASLDFVAVGLVRTRKSSFCGSTTFAITIPFPICTGASTFERLTNSAIAFIP